MCPWAARGQAVGRLTALRFLTPFIASLLGPHGVRRFGLPSATVSPKDGLSKHGYGDYAHVDGQLCCGCHVSSALAAEVHLSESGLPGTSISTPL